MSSFNLVDDPWLPVRYVDGGETELGLRAILRDTPQIDDLAISFSLEYVATLRMVVAVLQSAVNGPSSLVQKQRWLREHAELQPALDRYFEKWHERFELFHPERPFMQAPLKPGVPKPGTVAALRPDWASGNNATLFDHHIDSNPEPLAAGEAARALLTTLLFQPGGGVSKPFNRTDSPATKTLQVLVEGRNLWEGLVANAPVLHDPSVRPAWEQPEHDAERARSTGTTPEGWLDRASWRSRAVRLMPDKDGFVRQAQLQQHLKISDAPPFDPYAPIRRVAGKPPTPIRASRTKALWRDAEALIVGLRADDDHSTAVAEALQAFDRQLGVRIAGQVVMQAKLVDLREGRLPLSRDLLENDTHIEAVSVLVEASEDAAKALRGAIRHASAEMGIADGWRRAARWETGFWAALAGPFHARIQQLAATSDPEALHEEIVDPWRSKVAGAARDAYDGFAADGARGRAAEAIGHGQATLDRALRRLRPRTKEA